MRTTFVSATARCPKCRKVLDAATSMEGRSPAAGDVTVCIQCASTLVFAAAGKGKGLTLRLPSRAEAAECAKNPELAKMKVAIIRASRDPVNGWELK